MLETKILSIAQEAQEITRVLPSRHHENVPDPRIDQSLDGTKNHGAVVHRKKVLVGYTGERKQSRTDPTSQYDTFHERLAPRFSVRKAHS
jgi:hypothetical protein